MFLNSLAITLTTPSSSPFILHYFTRNYKYKNCT
nr:MAG TPA: hypothetical protein [Caudoviricetes sp.]DAV51436.1 MAG TPA: hypothetical protein [Caudoviricetes sp.]DAZ27872.1 MAG TPA: hypothetical protein [Caudoviricetes sp.]